MAIRMDDSRHPIVVVTFDGPSTDAEFRAYLDDMTRLVVARREPNVTILDARAAGSTPATQRRMQADWLEKHDAELRRYSAGTAFIITSAMVRGILTAILWLQPMAAPHVVVATFEEAEAWAREQLRARGVAAPATRAARP